MSGNNEVVRGGVIDIHDSADSVCVEMWENQRYKPMGGGWSKPFDEHAAYTDINGNSINVCSLRDVILKPGWVWSTPDWLWDKSDTFGETDEDGWSYATTFDDLFASSRAKLLSGVKKPMTSLVRRRRLLRQRHYKPGTPAALLFSNQLKWNSMQSSQLAEVLEIYKRDVQNVEIYEGKRRKSYLFVVEKILDRRHEGAVNYCNQYIKKIQNLKLFLEEKGMIEKNYAHSLGDLSRRWLDGGKMNMSLTAKRSGQAAPGVSGSSSQQMQRHGSASKASLSSYDGTTGLRGSSDSGDGDSKMPSRHNKQEHSTKALSSSFSSSSTAAAATCTTQQSLLSTSEVSAVSPSDSAGVGFFMSVSLAHFEVSDRLEAYANRILMNLVSETEDMERMLSDLASDCTVTGRKLKMDIINSEIVITNIVKALTAALSERKIQTAAECRHLYTDLRMEHARGPSDGESSRPSGGGGHRHGHGHGRSGGSNSSGGAIGGAGGFNGDHMHDRQQHDSLMDDTDPGVREYLSEPEYDIWFLIQSYRAAVLSADAKLLCYKSFLNAQLKEIQEMTTKLGHFLQLVLKIMVNEQVQSWVEFNDIITHMDIYDQSGPVGSCHVAASTGNSGGGSNSNSHSRVGDETLGPNNNDNSNNGDSNNNIANRRSLSKPSNQMISSLNRNILSNISMHFGQRESIAYSKLPKASMSTVAMHGFMYFQPIVFTKTRTSGRRASQIGGNINSIGGFGGSSDNSGGGGGGCNSVNLDRASVVGLDVDHNLNVDVEDAVDSNDAVAGTLAEDGNGENPWVLCRVVLTYEGTLYLYKLTDKQADRLAKCSSVLVNGSVLASLNAAAHVNASIDETTSTVRGSVSSATSNASGSSSGNAADAEFVSHRVIAPLQFSEFEHADTMMSRHTDDDDEVTEHAIASRARSLSQSQLQVGDQLGAMSRWCGDTPDITLYTEKYTVDVPVTSPIDYCIELHKKKVHQKRRQSVGIVEFNDHPKSPQSRRSKVNKRGVNADLDGCLLKLWQPSVTSDTTKTTTTAGLLNTEDIGTDIMINSSNSAAAGGDDDSAGRRSHSLYAPLSHNELLVTTRSWIRALSNPLVDPFYEPPVSYPYI